MADRAGDGGNTIHADEQPARGKVEREWREERAEGRAAAAAAGRPEFNWTGERGAVKKERGTTCREEEKRRARGRSRGRVPERTDLESLDSNKGRTIEAR